MSRDFHYSLNFEDLPIHIIREFDVPTEHNITGILNSLLFENKSNNTKNPFIVCFNDFVTAPGL